MDAESRPPAAPGPRAGGPPEEPPLLVPAPVLAELRRAVSEASGAEAADEVLFRLGRRWGEGDGRALAAVPGPPREAIERGLARLGELRLARVLLDEFHHAPSELDCRLVVRVRTGEPAGADGARCGLAIGYLTGMAGALLDLDVVCTPFQCSGCCGSTGCRFEIRPAHTWTPAERRPPAGSTRFFLRSLGPAMAGGDISLAELVENTGDAIIFVDTGDVVRFWNRGAEAMFGHARDEVVGRVIDMIVPDDLREEGELDWLRKRLDEEGVVGNHVTRRVRKDGTELSVSLTRTVLRDSAGAVVGSTVILRDVTQQTRAEQELERTRSLALIGELASTVAHEIKNPLAGIYAGIQLLRRPLEPGDERLAIFDDIAEEIRRLDQTVKDLLLFTRPPAPRKVLTDLATFLREVLDSPGLASHLEDHEVELAVGEGLLVPLDAGLMVPVVGNLLINSAQALDGPGAIRLAAATEGDLVRLTVSDSGPGIPEERLAAVFEPFYTTKARGSGLGLSIARKNVEAHGGTLLASSAAGGGACFEIRLPRGGQVASSPATTSTSSSKT